MLYTETFNDFTEPLRLLIVACAFVMSLKVHLLTYLLTAGCFVDCCERVWRCARTYDLYGARQLL